LRLQPTIRRQIRVDDAVIDQQRITRDQLPRAAIVEIQWILTI
jgi:hypothetical protein